MFKDTIPCSSSSINNGNVDKMEFIANLARLNEVISTAMTEARKHIAEEKQTVLVVYRLFQTL